MLKKLARWSLDAHSALPRPLLERLLRHALRDSSLALCLHRLKMSLDQPIRPSEQVIEAERLDELLELLGAGSARREPWLTVSFDDGYAEVAEYFYSRRTRFPDLRWLFFVCPAKLERRAGFRWDLPEGSPDSDPMGPPHDVDRENRRSDLAGLADRPESRLLTVSECRRLLQCPEVELGNHTNCHFMQSMIPLEASQRDIHESRAQFESLFGPTLHFAFPFGTPRFEFRDEHTELARQAGYSSIWSTEGRPFSRSERSAGAVLPRFPVVGSWPASKTATFIALSALRWRTRRLGGPRQSWLSSAH